jgi:hypothetical protein
MRFLRDFFNRTPGPPPFSSMNSMPPATKYAVDITTWKASVVSADGLLPRAHHSFTKGSQLRLALAYAPNSLRTHLRGRLARIRIPGASPLVNSMPAASSVDWMEARFEPCALGGPTAFSIRWMVETPTFALLASSLAVQPRRARAART